MIRRGQSCWPKIPCGFTTISELLSRTFTRALLLACTITSSKDVDIGASSIGLTILGETRLSNQEESYYYE
jgi:hypothetical protein